MQIQKEFRESEEQLRAIFTTSQDLIGVSRISKASSKYNTINSK